MSKRIHREFSLTKLLQSKQYFLLGTQFSDRQHQKWDEFLPEIMLALNTSISVPTGYSPAFLTQGRETRSPKALYDDVTVGRGAQNLRPDERSEELKIPKVLIKSKILTY